jgi:endonuclease/exonuclease/phosphatase family metal-dependent hydrolase
MRIGYQRRDVLRALLAAGGAASLNTQAWAQELISLPPVDSTLRVLLFNTHLLPSIAQGVAGHRGQSDYRTQAIAARLHHYDIVGLCEVFESKRRREIMRIVSENSGHAFHWFESPKPTGRHLICGGLLLFSRLPIVGQPHCVTYSKASRAYSHGYKADGFAAKGALHAQLRVDARVSIDCFLTHLESVSAEARTAQIHELAEFIAACSNPGRPLMLMGDMNVVADYPPTAGGEDSEYRELRNLLQHAGQPLLDIWPALQAGRGGTRDALAQEACNRIDYIFTSNGQRGGAWLEPAAARVEPFLDSNVKEGSLSDHAGVECKLTVRRA